MEEGKKSVDGVLENLALITDALQTLFEDGKMICLINEPSSILNISIKPFKFGTYNTSLLTTGCEAVY